MTRYEVERAPGQPRDRKRGWDGAGWRIVPVVDGRRLRPMFTRFHERQHAVDEALRLADRYRALVHRAV